MFKANNNGDDYPNGGGEDTVIGRSIKIEGDLVSNGSITVEGEVVGNLKTSENLRVGEAAKIVANVSAKNAQISGKIQGNVAVNDKLELAATAEINGDIQASALIIADGAVFNGRCSMTESSSQQMTLDEAKREE